MDVSKIDFLPAYAQAAGISLDEAKLAAVLMPHAMQRQIELVGGGRRLVHYTTASALESIIRNKAVWMRKVDSMNDASEVWHGMDLLQRACGPERFRNGLTAALDKISPEVRPEFEKYWNGWHQHLAPDTFVTCLSEHTENEDELGRLSMWRAYGRDCGVALVLNLAPFRKNPSQTLSLVTSPVAYLDEAHFMTQFGELVSNLEDNVDFLKTQPPAELGGRLFTTFRYIAIGTKHPAFLEELEWRIVYSPKMENSVHVEREIVVIRGVPQPIYKIPLRDIPEAGFEGASIPALLNRIIVGPTEYGVAIFDALVTLLGQAGVPEPEKRVFLSNIPLRSQ